MSCRLVHIQYVTLSPSCRGSFLIMIIKYSVASSPGLYNRYKLFNHADFGAPFRLYEHSSVANAGDAKRMPAVATGQSKSLRFMAKRQVLNHSLNIPRCFAILHLKDARQSWRSWTDFYGQDPSLTLRRFLTFT